MDYGYLVIVGGVALPFAFAVCWRLKTQFRHPIDEAFSDFAEGHRLTDAQLLRRLYAEEGGCSEVGFHAPSNSEVR